jgi:hypothetical protein
MPWTLEFTDEGKTVKVAYRGAFSPDELRAATHEILAAMLERKTTRALLDCYEAHMDVPVINVYQLPDLYESRGITRHTRAAVILPKDKYRLDIYEFYEDVCRNRGYNVKLFEDRETAWDWLQEP